jgi:hypothetical protein
MSIQPTSSLAIAKPVKQEELTTPPIVETIGVACLSGGAGLGFAAMHDFKKARIFDAEAKGMKTRQVQANEAVQRANEKIHQKVQNHEQWKNTYKKQLEAHTDNRNETRSTIEAKTLKLIKAHKSSRAELSQQIDLNKTKGKTLDEVQIAIKKHPNAQQELLPLIQNWDDERTDIRTKLSALRRPSDVIDYYKRSVIELRPKQPIQARFLQEDRNLFKLHLKLANHYRATNPSLSNQHAQLAAQTKALINIHTRPSLISANRMRYHSSKQQLAQRKTTPQPKYQLNEKQYNKAIGSRNDLRGVAKLKGFVACVSSIVGLGLLAYQFWPSDKTEPTS